MNKVYKFTFFLLIASLLLPAVCYADNPLVQNIYTCALAPMVYDGTIPTIPITQNAPTQLGNPNPYIKTEAETICWGSGVETEKYSEGGMDRCDFESGDYIKVNGVDFGSFATSFSTRIDSATSGRNIELRLDSPTGKLVGTCSFAGTSGWQTWADKTCIVGGATGIHDLYLKFTGGGGYLLNFGHGSSMVK